ncbi:MAG: hypothetical protein ABJ327_23310 [Litoreibacter sp.]
MSDAKMITPETAAEEKLIAELGMPERIVFGGGDLPTQGDDERTIRAEVIRDLLLGECGALHSKGLRLRGAYISGALDLQGGRCERDLTLSQCVVHGEINLVNSQMRGLYISGSQIGSIAADNARFEGSVYLRNKTSIDGEISLAGARISGDLQLVDASIHSKRHDAIFAPSLRVEGSVFLGNYPYSDGVSTLTATGLLFFSSARVEHDFFMTNTALELPDNGLGTPVFGASEEHGRDMVLSLARARIGGILYFADNQITSGIVNLAGAAVERLRDEPWGPGATYPIRLDGFRYTDFSRHTVTDVKARLGWLDRRPPDTPFTAQPYEHLAGVLIALGNRNDARTVLMAKERQLRRAYRDELAERGASYSRRIGAAILDRLMNWTIGYGYRPGRSVVVALVLILGLGLFFERTWQAGDMTPNSAPVLVSANWIAATKDHPENPGKYWSSTGQAGQDWETFNSFAYATDLVIPLVSLGQESAWAPSTSRSPLGKIGWWARWGAKGIGWIVTALGAAAITGVIRKE